MEDLHWFLNQKLSLDLKENVVGSLPVKNNVMDDQTKLTKNMSVSKTKMKYSRKCAGTHSEYIFILCINLQVTLPINVICTIRFL